MCYLFRQPLVWPLKELPCSLDGFVVNRRFPKSKIRWHKWSKTGFRGNSKNQTGLYPNTSDAYLISATGFKYEICFDAGNSKINPVVLIDNGNRFSKNNPGAKILESSCIITEIEDGPNLGIFIDTNNAQL